MTLWSRLTGGEQRHAGSGIVSIEDYINAVGSFQFDGLSYSGGIQQTLTGGQTERIGGHFQGLAAQAHRGNPIVFACMGVRSSVFSSVRFRWQRLRDGKPSDSFGSSELDVLHTPWVGGTSQDLLGTLIQDADLAGNAYQTLDTPLARVGGAGGGEFVRLRPDWIEILAQKRILNGGQVGWRRAGYFYTEGGIDSGNERVPLLPDEVAHFAPTTDPLASFRGMSWLTPLVREIQADALMTRHKSRFFDHGATPNMIVTHPEGADIPEIKRFIEWLAANVEGLDNAYKTLNLYPGSDATVVGSNMQQIDFKQVQGAGETRIAAAASVPPVIVGLSEGLQAATYSNYAQARRRFADGTCHPLWGKVAGSLAVLLDKSGLPGKGRDVRLWYDSSDVPFLREDEKDSAEIAEMQARTIRSLVDGGYTPESAVAAVEAGDWRILVHTGLYSVQLQRPGQETPQPTPVAAST